MTPTHAIAMRLYRLMRLTRLIEDRVRALYYERRIVGGVYTSRGMEATAVGAADALRAGDVLVPLHRDLGALLARGITPREVFCQYLGRGNALSHGRDGQLHIGDMRERMIVPTTSVVGSSLPVAVGTALAAKMRSEGRVTLAFIGEGGTSTGDFHEALGLAACAWVPFVCVVEHNGYAYSTPSAKQARLASFAERAAAYGIPGTSVDGNDALAVRAEVERAVERAREGGGPALIEARTFRMRGHSEADQAEYVPATLLVEWEARDPIMRLEAMLRGEGELAQTDLDGITAGLQAIVEDAEAFALASPAPDPAELAAHVWCDDGSGRVKPRRVRVTAVRARLGPDRTPPEAMIAPAGALPAVEAARPL
jgi:TPP-dependent pyruvate/acetoin dehydrogenase alpha subunit